MGLLRTLKFSLLVLMLASMHAHALTVLDVLTDEQGKYIGPSVEENIVSMDTDKNGFADASEVRAFLERKHGKGYESALLEKFEASVNGTSCNTPFANKLYESN